MLEAITFSKNANPDGGNHISKFSIELQRLNSEMILQRLLRDEVLVDSDIKRIECATKHAVRPAREGLNANEEWKEEIRGSHKAQSKQEINTDDAHPEDALKGKSDEENNTSQPGKNPEHTISSVHKASTEEGDWVDIDGE